MLSPIKYLKPNAVITVKLTEAGAYFQILIHAHIIFDSEVIRFPPKGNSQAKSLCELIL